MGSAIKLLNLNEENNLRDKVVTLGECELPTYTKEMFGHEKWIDLEELIIDSDAQRTLMESHVRKIMRDFSPSAFGRITVSKRPNGYHIQDGQHRAECARRLGIKTIPCVLVDSVGVKDDATNFIKINENAMQVSAIDKFRIGVNAGVPEWVRVHEVIVDRCGLAVGTGANRVSAVSSIFKYINCATLEESIKNKMDIMEISLRILKETVGTMGICQISILGMCIFVKEYITTNMTTEEVTISRFKNIDMNYTIRQAQIQKANGTQNNIITHFAWLLYEDYNRNLRSNRLPNRIYR